MAEKGPSPRDLVIGRPTALHQTSERIIHGDDDVAEGVSYLSKIEPRFASIVAIHGLPRTRRVENNLSTLLNIITEQLISVKAAATIWQRIHARLHPFEPSQILEVHHDDLRQLGITAAKARCFHAISKAVHTGELNFQELNAMQDEKVQKLLTALPGVGPWTADIFLLAALGRADACPSGDLALQIAAQDIFNLDQRPSSMTFLLMAEPWRPWRSVAARLLWSHYQGSRGAKAEGN